MNAARRRLDFAKARAPVAIAMRAVAASVALQARAAGVEPPARRSVFARRAPPAVAAPFMIDTMLGTVADKDLH